MSFSQFNRLPPTPRIARCNGSGASASREFDNVVIEKSGGRWAVATCPMCQCRVGVMRPTKRHPELSFGTHNISVRAASRKP